MFIEWNTKDNSNIKYYFTINIINDTPDTILMLKKEESTMYVLYDNWIEKKYKELYYKEHKDKDIIDIFKIIYEELMLESFNEQKFIFEFDNDECNYITKCFDLIVDTLNIKLLDLYYMNAKKLYLNNTCCDNITFILFSIIAIIFLSRDISNKLDIYSEWTNKEISIIKKKQ
jgi:hypothetical protein